MAKLGFKANRYEKQAKAEAAVNQEEVAKLAYELYQKRGGQGGNDWQDWFEAEAQLKRQN